MNIVVCMKPVPDVNYISLNPITNAFEEDDLAYIVNPSDSIALEEAVRIKESNGGGRISMISMAPPQTKRLLYHCLASGADESFLLWDKGFNTLDSYTTAKIIAKAISLLQYDLILCGSKAIDDEAGQVGGTLAEMIRIPWVSRVCEIQSLDNARIKVVRKLEKGKRELCEVNLPAVVSIDIELNEFKYASLPQLFTALRKDIKEYNLSTLGLSMSDIVPKLKITGMQPARPRVKKTFTPDSNLPPEERVRLLMTGGITKKGGGFLEGDSLKVASDIVSFLKKEKLFSFP